MAATIVQFVTIYGCVGLAVGIGFLFLGIERADPAAHESHAFRPLLLPGLTLLWPYVAWRWWRAVR